MKGAKQSSELLLLAQRKAIHSLSSWLCFVVGFFYGCLTDASSLALLLGLVREFSPPKEGL